MINTILGSKVKMSQTFKEGSRIPVTKIVAGPCVVTQVKSEEKDKYWAVQLGFAEKKTKNTTKPMQGHLKTTIKGNIAPRYIREIRFNTKPEYKVGDRIKASDIFVVGDVVSVTGISKGKGFAGVVKRWRFAGGPKTHGQSDRLRAPGAIGQGTTPGRIYKGKHMGGRMGSETVTVKNLKVVAVNPEKNEVEVSGPIPGRPGSLVVLRRLNERKEESNA